MASMAEQRGPNNRLYSRGPRRRLSAEQIRDLALAASGQLVERIGGPSVRPRQDPSVGRFRDLTAGVWESSPGAGQYRRSVYTFWQRMSPYPALVIFDAPSRETCTVQRRPTNTPLQSLTLMNDPHFVSLAEQFALRIQKHDTSVEARLRFAFLATLSRPPTATELDWFGQFVDEASTPNAWFQVAQVLLNLDETLSPE